MRKKNTNHSVLVVEADGHLQKALVLLGEVALLQAFHGNKFGGDLLALVVGNLDLAELEASNPVADLETECYSCSKRKAYLDEGFGTDTSQGGVGRWDGESRDEGSLILEAVLGLGGERVGLRQTGGG